MDPSPASGAAAHYSSSDVEPTLAALWRRRDLLWSLVSRDLKVKYQRSALGFLWTLLNPLMMVLVLVMVFNSVLRMAVDGFWAFLISGFFVWGFGSEAMNRATTLLRTHAALRRSVVFPGEVVVLSTLITKMIEFLIQMAIVLPALFIFHHHAVPQAVLLLPYLMLLQFLITAGMVFPLSVLAVLHYDVEHAMPAMMRLWFFLTPIFYPLSMIPESIRPYFYLNPYAGLIDMFHQVLYEGIWPSWALLGGVSAMAVGLFAVGYWIFNQYKDACVELA